MARAKRAIPVVVDQIKQGTRPTICTTRSPIDKKLAEHDEAISAILSAIAN